MTTRPQFLTFEQAARRDPTSGEAELARALERQDWEEAAAIALARSEAGRGLPGELVERLAPRVDVVSIAAALMLRASGDRISLIVRLLDAGQMADERDVTALAIAVHLLEGAAPPEALRLRMVDLKYRPMDNAARLLRAAALAAVGQPPSSALAQSLGSWLEQMKQSPAGLFPEGRVIRAVSPIRNTQAKLGRNDLCHCGSGLKYKKCHEGQDAEAPAQQVEVSLADEAPRMTYQRVAGLRVMELEKLPFDALSDDALLAAIRGLVRFARWPEGERVLEVAGTRPALKTHVIEARLDLIDRALEVGADEVAARQSALVPVEEQETASWVSLALVGPRTPQLEAIEQAALRGLTEEVGVVDLSHALLRRAPALGVLVARGAVGLGRALDNDVLLEAVHRGREWLGLTPQDPADQLADLAEERSSGERLTRLLRIGKQAHDEALASRVEALAAEAREARERAADLERSLRIAERQVARLPTPTAAAEPQEVRTLRNRVEELKRLVQEGSETRARLRRELAAQEEELSRQPSGPAEDLEEAEDQEDVGSAAEAPSQLLVPRFSAAAIKSLASLPRHVKASAIERSGALGAARPGAWSGVKRMARDRAVHSARLGLHYRLLFSIAEAELVVEDVIPRRELEAWLGRR